jgi:hypothetical protein
MNTFSRPFSNDFHLLGVIFSHHLVSLLFLSCLVKIQFITTERGDRTVRPFVSYFGGHRLEFRSGLTGLSHSLQVNSGTVF